MTEYSGACHVIVQRILAGERVEQWEIHDHIARSIRKRLDAGETTEGLVDLFLDHATKAQEGRTQW